VSSCERRQPHPAEGSGKEPERLRKAAASYGCRSASASRTCAQKPCLSIFDLLGQAVVDAGDGRFELEAGIVGGPRFATTLPGHVAEDESEVTQTVPSA
jgi:hypothetical protein